ncbi:MAG: 30S ribosomal protein S1 [Rickettsiales endosymbiont of Dermacentor nuttalli]
MANYYRNVISNVNVEQAIADYSTKENFNDLFNASLKNEKKEGTVVKGEIISIENDLVTIDIGLKAEGQIPLKEFTLAGEEDEINVGDVVEVFLEKLENRSGKTVISREKAIREKAWADLEKALDKSARVEGIISGKVKGGFTVDISGVLAFLPGSQVDIKPIKDISHMMGVLQPFQVLKVDRKQGNIVVSRRAILEESRLEARNELLSNINEGQVLEGVVKNITDYGAFIDLGSVDGLLHITDISWNRISHPSEVLTHGQVVKVQVIKYNHDTKRISLGMKQLEGNPWQNIESKYPKGTKSSGKITNITDYGVFVELETGIEGLVHISEMSWSKNNVNPKKVYSVGQEIDFIVLDIDINKHRISLGIKQCSNNPWADFADKYPVGSIVEGEVKNIVDFGLFIGFDNDIDGLVYISDLSWDEDNVDELNKYQRGDKLSAVVLAVDSDKERISLGIKQLTANQFADNLKDLQKGDIITCTVTNVHDDGIDVTFNDGITSFIKKSDLASEKVEQRVDRFNVGDRVDAKVVSVDKTNCKVNLSIKLLEIEEQKRAIAEYGSTDSGASLGDILGAALNKANSEDKKD